MAINQGFWLIYIVLYKPYKCSKTYFLSQKYLIQQNRLINKLLYHSINILSSDKNKKYFSKIFSIPLDKL